MYLFLYKLISNISANLHIWALKFRNKDSVTGKDSNMKFVAMRIADKHVACIRNINAIRKIGDVLTTNAAQESTLIVEHDNTVPLEIAHIKFFACNNVTILVLAKLR